MHTSEKNIPTVGRTKAAKARQGVKVFITRLDGQLVHVTTCYGDHLMYQSQCQLCKAGPWRMHLDGCPTRDRELTTETRSYPSGKRYGKGLSDTWASYQIHTRTLESLGLR